MAARHRSTPRFNDGCRWSVVLSLGASFRLATALSDAAHTVSQPVHSRGCNRLTGPSGDGQQQSRRGHVSCCRRSSNTTSTSMLLLSGDMVGRAWNTQDGYARDLREFLNFLWHNRNRTSWHDATTTDHLAYLAWRRTDPADRASTTELGSGSHCGQSVLYLAGEGAQRAGHSDPAAGATTDGARCRAA